MLQEKSNLLVVYNFTKRFSGTRVNQTVNKCLNGCLVFAVCYFRFSKKPFPKLLLDKEIDDVGNHREECFCNYDTAK